MTRLDAKNLAKRIIKQGIDVFLILGCVFILFYSIVNASIKNFIIVNVLEVLALPIFEYLYLYFAIKGIKGEVKTTKNFFKEFSMGFYFKNLVILIAIEFACLSFSLLETFMLDFELHSPFGKLVYHSFLLAFIMLMIFMIYRMMFVPYITFQKHDISLKDAIKESNNLLRGRILKLLFLELTFIGWIILILVLMAGTFVFFKTMIVPYIILTIGFSLLTPYILIVQIYYFHALAVSDEKLESQVDLDILGSNHQSALYRNIYDGSLTTTQGMITLRKEEKKQGLEVYDTFDDWLEVKLKREFELVDN